jgi:hypothetical protein
MKGLLAAAFVLLLPTASLAQAADEWREWPLGDPFRIKLEAFFPRLDTSVRLDASDGSMGTTIDFEQNLGMSDTESLPAFGFSWRFAKKHQLIFDYFDLSRSGSAVTTTEIRFGDEVYQVDLPIASFFNTQSTSIGYSYSLLFDEKKEVALAAGLSVQDISFGLLGTGAGKIEEQAGLTAPLPAFGLTGAYAFTEKWIGRVGVGYFGFSLSLDEASDLSGEIVNGLVSIEHNTFEHVQFGLTYSYFDVRVDFEDLQRISSIKYTYHGPKLSVNIVF